MERKEITKIVLVALFAALIAAGAFIKIPLVPVPVTLTTLFVLLAALCLSPLMALSSIVVYLFLPAVLPDGFIYTFLENIPDGFGQVQFGLVHSG